MAEALAIGRPADGGDTEIVLFVRLTNASRGRERSERGY